MADPREVQPHQEQTAAPIPPQVLRGPRVRDLRLFDLVDREGRRQFLLRFGRVRGLASRILGQLVALHHKLQAVGGRLVLCEVSPSLYEFFEATKLPGVLCIRDGEEEALKALTSAP